MIRYLCLSKMNLAIWLLNQFVHPHQVLKLEKSVFPPQPFYFFWNFKVWGPSSIQPLRTGHDLQSFCLPLQFSNWAQLFFSQAHWSFDSFPRCSWTCQRAMKRKSSRIGKVRKWAGIPKPLPSRLATWFCLSIFSGKHHRWTCSTLVCLVDF